MENVNYCTLTYYNLLKNISEGVPNRFKELGGFLLSLPKVLPHTFEGLSSDEMELRMRDQCKHYEVFREQLSNFAKENGIDVEKIFVSYWCYVLPYFLSLLDQNKSGSSEAKIIGVLGVQGAGKTTFSGLFEMLAKQSGKTAVVFSIDDFYLTYEAREELKNIDPRLSMRGPPGTHQTRRLKDVLRKIKRRESPIEIPIFDKSLHNGLGDESGYRVYNEEVDFVVLEGWMIGLEPLKEEELFRIPPIYSDEDEKFARDCSARLEEYSEIWRELQSLIVLSPTDYEFSRIWRKQAEDKLRKRTGRGMDDSQIDKFVDYFWKALHPKIYIEKVIKQQHYDMLVQFNLDHSIAEMRKGSINPRLTTHDGSSLITTDNKL